MVTLTIDGREVTVPEGTTILHAAEALGIDIPHLCYCPGLEGTGACRLCVVEVERIKGLVVACMRRVAEGMVVHTRTPRVLEARQFVIELLLSRHPGLCLSCDKSGSCKLQQYAYELGIKQPFFEVCNPGYEVKEDLFIVRDYNLCILCGRCIRVCRLQGADILDFVKRGIETRVATPLDRSLLASGCDFCGSCVSVCPTGALLEKARLGRGREWELTETPSHCSYCGAACELHYHLRRGEIVKVSSPSPVAYLCARGRFGYGYLQSDQRLTSPLLRQGEKLVPARWDEALDLVAEQLQQARERYGAEGVGGILSPLVSCETAYAFQKLFRAGLRTGNVDSSLRLGAGSELLAAVCAVTGGPEGYAGWQEVLEADVLFLVGDVCQRVPAAWSYIKRAVARGAKLIYLSFYRDRPVRVAHAWLRSCPGEEPLVLAHLARLILQQPAYRTLAERIPNFTGFAAEVEKLTAMPLELPEEELARAAELWAGEVKGVLLLPLDGVTAATGKAALNLLLLTGRREKALFPCCSLVNAQGVWRMGGVVEFFPGLRPVPIAAGEFAAFWGRVPNGELGLDLTAMLQPGSPVKALYLLGEDPLGSYPGRDRVAAKLEELDFLVVQDLFLTPTAARAQVVLPLAALPETGGTVIAAHGDVHHLSPAIPSRTLMPWQVFSLLAAKMNFELNLSTQEALFNEIRSVTPEFGLVPAERRPGFWEVGSVSPPSGEGAWRLTIRAFYPSFYRYDWLEKSGLTSLLPHGGDFVALSPEEGLEEGAEIKITTAGGAYVTRVHLDPALERGVAAVPAHSPAAAALFLPETLGETVWARLERLVEVGGGEGK
ncbi:molybdopterin-dependent oxidoreductase [Desulfothermobacter acidiphilus]|uniref:molybdopterin-dependent oxidoreductase n=1 Tax=Desulfothermobacter acidiphilus TaxID=1938353 RepID=UPI003F8B239D